MHSSIAHCLAFLALAVSAAPTPRASPSTVQVQFANDLTGANGNAYIPLNGTPIDLGSAYKNTNLFANGKLLVTSLEFTADFANVQCTVLKTGSTHIFANIVDPEADFQKFATVPVDWATGFTITCDYI